MNILNNTVFAAAPCDTSLQISGLIVQNVYVYAGMTALLQVLCLSYNCFYTHANTINYTDKSFLMIC